MTKLITITEMARSFSDIIGRVHYRGESFYIKKGSNIVARLSPIASNATIQIKDLNSLFSSTLLKEEDDVESFRNIINDLRKLKDTGVDSKWD